jgi:hypothetical protein
MHPELWNFIQRATSPLLLHFLCLFIFASSDLALHYLFGGFWIPIYFVFMGFRLVYSFEMMVDRSY